MEDVVTDNALGSSTAVEKQVDQMETLATTFVVPILIVLLAAADITKDFELFGFHLALKDGFWERGLQHKSSSAAFSLS
jgi:hypothetical protein